LARGWWAIPRGCVITDAGGDAPARSCRGIALAQWIRVRAWLLAALFVAPSAGCLDGMVPAHRASSAPLSIHAPQITPDAFVTLKDPAAAHDELCTNDGLHPNFPDDADLITKTFCADLKGQAVPQPGGIVQLAQLLGLGFADSSPAGENGAGGNPAFAIAGASSSLVARFVSAINPRAFLFTPPPSDGGKPSGFAVLTFTRGESFVEAAVHDPTLEQVNFYLVRFQPPCGDACTNADRLTPALESGWSGVSIYESSTALNNTVLDCLECHQPDASQPKLLRLPEGGSPYTHFFSSQTTGGQALLADFHAAHGDGEDWGPIPAAMIDKSDPEQLRALVAAAGFAQQPNPFDATQIEREVEAWAPAQPWDNDPKGKSATWQALYDQAAAGQFIAAPYHDVKVTDAAKLAQMTGAYRDFLGGARPDLPDIRDVFLDDGLRDMGFAPRQGANGRALLVQMCQQCHDSQLDQTLTRARFDVETLDSLGREEKDKAIARLMKDDADREKMPPTLFRTVTHDERQKMVDELSK
jgi:hypothetical protein